MFGGYSGRAAMSEGPGTKLISKVSRKVYQRAGLGLPIMDSGCEKKEKECVLVGWIVFVEELEGY